MTPYKLLSFILLDTRGRRVIGNYREFHREGIAEFWSVWSQYFFLSDLPSTALPQSILSGRCLTLHTMIALAIWSHPFSFDAFDVALLSLAANGVDFGYEVHLLPTNTN